MNKQPITYLNHLRNELRALAKRPILIIFVIILTLYHSRLDQLLTITFWLQWIGSFIIIFPIGTYVGYKYMQKNRCLFKERLSAAIRADDNITNILKNKKIRLRHVSAGALAQAGGYAETKVIAALIMRDSKILIAQRAKKDALFGKWEFPGGKMENGETEQECLVRELNEEFGIQAEIGDYFCSSFFEHRDATWEMRAYFVQSFTGEIELREHQEVRWVSIEELSGYDMPDADKPIVEKLLKEFYRK